MKRTTTFSRGEVCVTLANVWVCGANTSCLHASKCVVTGCSSQLNPLNQLQERERDRQELLAHLPPCFKIDDPLSTQDTDLFTPVWSHTCSFHTHPVRTQWSLCFWSLTQNHKFTDGCALSGVGGVRRCVGGRSPP